MDRVYLAERPNGESYPRASGDGPAKALMGLTGVKVIPARAGMDHCFTR